MSGTLGVIVTIFGLLIGLAMIAVLVSQNAQTSAVINAASSGGASLIGAAIKPVTSSNNGTML
jgi:hypothetical protein